MPPTQMPGSFWRRAAAALIDVAILGVGLTLIEIILKRAWESSYGSGYDASVAMYWMLILAPILISGLYSVGFETDCGATLGKQALGLRVSRPGGSQPGPLRLAARWLLHALSFAILGIGFLMLLWTKNRQTLHDLLTDTLVVRGAAQD